MFAGTDLDGYECPIGSRRVCTLFLPFHGLKPVHITISSDLILKGRKNLKPQVIVLLCPRQNIILKVTAARMMRH